MASHAIIAPQEIFMEKTVNFARDTVLSTRERNVTQSRLQQQTLQRRLKKRLRLKRNLCEIKDVDLIAKEFKYRVFLLQRSRARGQVESVSKSKRVGKLKR